MWTAIYWQHYHRFENSFVSLKEAVDFLGRGEQDSTLSTDGVRLPDGTVIDKRSKDPSVAWYSKAWIELLKESETEVDFWKRWVNG